VRGESGAYIRNRGNKGEAQHVRQYLGKIETRLGGKCSEAVFEAFSLKGEWVPGGGAMGREKRG